MGSGASKKKKRALAVEDNAGADSGKVPDWAQDKKPNGGARPPADKNERGLPERGSIPRKRSMVVKSAASDSVQNQLRRQQSAKRMSLMRKARRKMVRGTRHGTVSCSESSGSVTAASFPTVEKSERELEVIVNSLKTNFLFAGKSADTLLKMAKCMKKEVAPAGSDVIKQGEINARTFYVVGGGEIEFSITEEECGIDVTRLIGSTKRGGNFGEIALMYECPRTATCRVSQDGEAMLWALERAAFRFYNSLGSGDTGTDNGMSMSSTLAQRLKLIKNIPILDQLSGPALERVCKSLVRYTAEDGVDIVREGEVGDIMYFIEEGTIGVWKTDVANGETKVTSMGSGQFFGERALLASDTRQATCRCEGEVTLLCLSRDTFNSVKDEISSTLEAEMARQEEAERKFYAARARELKLITLEELTQVCVLGKGSFGLVKLVQHKPTGRAYALKILQKQHMVDARQAQSVIWEKRIMHRIVHPFCLKLCATMTDKNCLYLLMEFLQGGDLFIKLCYEYGHFDQPQSMYYAACVLSAFSYCHKKNILYRDLKPENLVLNRDGVLKVVDFGMAKIAKKKTFTVCGTPEYMSPEIVTGKGHHKGADYWALGVLIYELLNGQTPFAIQPHQPQLKVYKKINAAKVKFPVEQEKEMPEATSLIRLLLTKLVLKRGGCTAGGAEDLKMHPWFTEQPETPLDFDRLENLEYPPPIKPQVEGEFDASNFDDFGDAEDDIVEYELTGMGWETTWNDEF